MGIEDLLNAIRKIAPDANHGFDNDGQVIIYTGLQMQDDDQAYYLPLVEYSNED